MFYEQITVKRRIYMVMFYYMFFFNDPLFKNIFFGGGGIAFTVHVDTYMIIISLFMHILYALLLLSKSYTLYTNSLRSKGNNS